MILRLAGLPDSEIKRLIHERCSEYGLVIRVDLYHHIDRTGRIFALVEMVGEHALAQLLRAFNAPRFGDSAMLHLMPWSEP